MMANGDREHYPIGNQFVPQNPLNGTHGSSMMLTPPISPIVVNPLRTHNMNQSHRVGLTTIGDGTSHQPAMNQPSGHSYPYLSHVGQSSDSYPPPTTRQYISGYQGSSCYPTSMFRSSSYNTSPLSKTDSDVSAYSYSEAEHAQYRDGGYYNSCAMNSVADTDGVIQNTSSYNRGAFNMAQSTYGFTNGYQHGGKYIVENSTVLFNRI